MKSKIFNSILASLAVVGFIIVMGGIGTMDFMVERSVNYPLINSIKTIGIGMLLMTPCAIKIIF